MRIKLLLAVCVLATSFAAAADTATTPLDTWLNGLKSLRVQFTQATKDAQGKAKEQSSGELLVLRPGRFRWESHADSAGAQSSGASALGGQLLVADGHNFWFYDPELQQVQVRPIDAALTATPVMLLTGGADVRKAFDISDAGQKDGLTWVRVKPRAAEADFRQSMLGFSGGELRQMILEDKLGEVSTLSFSRSQRNAPVAPAEVSFTPPPGVDVIGTPQK